MFIYIGRNLNRIGNNFLTRDHFSNVQTVVRTEWEQAVRVIEIARREVMVMSNLHLDACKKIKPDLIDGSMFFMYTFRQSQSFITVGHYLMHCTFFSSSFLSQSIYIINHIYTPYIYNELHWCGVQILHKSH